MKTCKCKKKGLFSDFLKDGTVFYRFTNMQLLNKAVLRGKIQYIKNLGLDVYHEAMMYFRIYFNNLIRNKIAHGTYTYENSDDAEIFAIELFLDLEYLIFMISRKSETEKMYRILHNYLLLASLRPSRQTSALARCLPCFHRLSCTVAQR